MDDEIEPAAYKRAFRETPNPAIIAGKDYVIRDANQALLEFTGYDRDEVIGQTPDFVMSDAEQFFGEVAPLLYEGKPWIGSFELKAKDERFRYGYGTATPLYEADEIIGYVGVFVDITRRRRAEQTTRILNRVLRHNLRNDANVILGHLSLLRDSDTPDPDHSISVIESRLTRLLSRADTARDLENLLSTDADTDIGPIRIDDMLQQEVEDVRARYPGAEFSVEASEVYAIANSALAKGFEAVLENAVEHNDSDVPEIEVRIDTDDSHVHVAVSDNGPGIPEGNVELALGLQELDQIRHGQGLDLFFVSELMTEYSGRLSIEQNTPRGLVFTFHLRRR